VGVPGGERGNVKTGMGNRMSTISQPGCSTSVALATGPTDEEEGMELDSCNPSGIYSFEVVTTTSGKSV